MTFQLCDFSHHFPLCTLLWYKYFYFILLIDIVQANNKLWSSGFKILEILGVILNKKCPHNFIFRGYFDFFFFSSSFFFFFFLIWRGVRANFCLHLITNLKILRKYFGYFKKKYVHKLILGVIFIIAPRHNLFETWWIYPGWVQGSMNTRSKAKIVQLACSGLICN